MSLTTRAKADAERITSDLNGWGSAMLFTAKTGETADVGGRHSKHHTSFDSQGQKLNGKSAYVSIAEKYLTELNYPVRDDSREVIMVGDLVTVGDSTGQSWTYKIREVYPDERLGLIVCILVDYTS
jgi:hypothetical protein